MSLTGLGLREKIGMTKSGLKEKIAEASESIKSRVEEVVEKVTEPVECRVQFGRNVDAFSRADAHKEGCNDSLFKFSLDVGKRSAKEPVEVANNVSFEKEEDAPLSDISDSFQDVQTVLKKLDLQTIQSTVVTPQTQGNVDGESSSSVVPSHKQWIKQVKLDIIEGVDEDVVEVELERPINDPHTHDIHCPNCHTIITRVVLRRRRITPIPTPVTCATVLLGCLNCFKLFLQRVNPFTCFQGSEIPQPREPKIDPEDRPTIVVIPDLPVRPPVPGQESNKALEILKSIVYGGLVELMTSLSVLSSAAASDVSTVNILALALANLVGGLFVFIHSLRDLKNSQPDQTNTIVDRYEQELGRRDNFLLHAVFAVLSFIVFGLVPPAVYAFSFYESNDKDLKIIAVAAATLFCISLLAFGKAYIKRTPGFTKYLASVSYYTVAAFSFSGASYASGDLIKRLIEKLGLFDKTTGMAVPLPQTSSLNQPWASI